MRIHFFWLGLIILSGGGCGGEADSPAEIQGQRAKYSYPALNKSPLPPPPPANHSKTEVDSSPRALFSSKPNQSRAITKDYVGLQGEIEKMELIKQLREHSAQIGTNSPFYLTEKEIEEIANLDNPVLN